MKPKTMILMVVAVGCGLGASYMTSKLLAERSKQAEVPTVPVLVAKARVPSWQPIKEPDKFFELKQYPQDVAPKRAIREFEKVKDQRVKTFIEEGKPLTEDDLVNKEQADLAGQLKDNQRATAIKVTAETLLGGFILPGTRVDVVCTMRGTEVASKVILQNMLVLAVDTNDTRPDQQKTILGSTVTLAAAPEEAQRLALAGSLGELRLMLRAHGDNDPIKGALVIRPQDLDRPLTPSKADKIEDPVPPPTGGTGGAILLPPELPKDEKMKEEAPVPVKVEPKVEQARKVEPAEDKEPVEQLKTAPVQLARPKKAERHVMHVREGSKVERLTVATKRDDNESEEGAEDEAADKDAPAPVKKEDKPQTKPQPKVDSPRTNPAPAADGSSTKTGRTRTSR